MPNPRHKFSQDSEKNCPVLKQALKAAVPVDILPGWKQRQIL